jgi:uncharacterized protein (TIGR02271 family)
MHATSGEEDVAHTMQAREEELQVRKDSIQTGEVRLRKEVHTEHKTIHVPVTKEEIVIERHPSSGCTVAASEAGQRDEIRVPVKEEQVHVEAKSAGHQAR